MFSIMEEKQPLSLKQSLDFKGIKRVAASSAPLLYHLTLSTIFILNDYLANARISSLRFVKVFSHCDINELGNVSPSPYSTPCG